MSSGEIDLYYTVQARDNLGRYLAKLNAAIIAGLEETVKEGERVAKEEAPEKTGALKASIQGVLVSPREGVLGVGTDHWQYTENGAAPHPIKGEVSFFWKSRGRQWTPGSNVINHPGTKAVHYMAHARDVMRARMAANIKANM